MYLNSLLTIQQLLPVYYMFQKPPKDNMKCFLPQVIALQQSILIRKISFALTSLQLKILISQSKGCNLLSQIEFLYQIASIFTFGSLLIKRSTRIKRKWMKKGLLKVLKRITQASHVSIPCQTTMIQIILSFKNKQNLVTSFFKHTVAVYIFLRGKEETKSLLIPFFIKLSYIR